MRAAHTALLFLAAASAASANDALLDQALARKVLPPGQVQGMVRTSTKVIGGDEPETEVTTADPRKDPKKALPSYADLKRTVGIDAHMVSTQAGRTIYSFVTKYPPRGFTKAGDVSVSMDGSDEDQTFVGKAEVSLDAAGRPYISHLDLRLQEPSGNLIAKVKKIDLSYAFAPAADGDAMVTTAMTADVNVRALLFVHREAHAESVLVPPTQAAP